MTCDPVLLSCVTVTDQVRLVTAGDVWSRLAAVCHGDSSGTSGDSG